jgi:hypothetical protein
MEMTAMPLPAPRKKKPRAPSGVQDTPMSSNLPNLSGTTALQSAPPPQNASEQWNDAYRQLHDRS